MNLNMEKMISFLKEKEMRHQIIDDNRLVMIGNTEKVKGIQILMFFREVKNGAVQYAQISVPKLSVFPEDKLADMYRLCNKLNKDYCGVSFYVAEKTHAVVVNVRSIATSANVASNVYSDVVGMVSCIDEAYPQIMKEIWS